MHYYFVFLYIWINTWISHLFRKNLIPNHLLDGCLNLYSSNKLWKAIKTFQQSLKNNSIIFHYLLLNLVTKVTIGDFPIKASRLHRLLFENVLLRLNVKKKEKKKWNNKHWKIKDDGYLQELQNYFNYLLFYRTNCVIVLTPLTYTN